MHLPLDVLNTDQQKIEEKMKAGIWLGVIDRTEETLIGTELGVMKCRTIKRRPEGQQWNNGAIPAMKGIVQQPQPGVPSDRVLCNLVLSDRVPRDRVPSD